jgi:8-oxo-dGTP diphosphatase
MSYKYKCVKATVGAIVERDGQILLALRNHEPFENHWCLPGGHIDFSEEVEDAMMREVQEETGLSVTESSFFNYFTEYYPELDWHAVALVFIVKAEGILKRQESEVRELRWFPIPEALTLPLAFEHQKIITSFYKL